MLSRPDRVLAERDRRLPGLAIVLDIDALLERLTQRAPTAGLQDGQITYVRYKPGTSCLVGYRLQLSGGAIDTYACALTPEAREKLHKIGTLRSVPGPLGSGWTILDDLSIAVATFPNDRQLIGLRRLAEPDERRSVLRSMLPLHAELWSGELCTLRYKPERRYVGRLMSDHASAVVRIYGRDEYPKAHRRLDRFRTTSRLRIARSLGRSNPNRTIVLEWLHGRGLNDVAASAPELSAAAGVVLAELHAQPPAGLPVLTKETEIRRIQALIPPLSFQCPQLSTRMADLARQLGERIARRPDAYSTSHGDFCAEQVLLENGRAAVLDLDEAVHAHPGRDLGNFIARANYDALQGRLPPGVAQRMRSALLEGYRLTAGRLPECVDLYTAVSLLQLVLNPFRERAADWPDRMEAILTEVEGLLGESARGMAVPAALSLHSAPGDPAMPFLARAIDPGEVEAACRRRLQEFLRGGDLRVREIRVMRHKHGRRCLIEYDVEVARPGGRLECATLVGKARAGGTDARTYGLARALWSAGFDGTNRDGIGIPEPIGMLPEFHMWLQRKAAGRAATTMFTTGGPLALAGRIASAIHKVHEAGIPPAREHTMSDELRILELRLHDVAVLHPEWKGRLTRVLKGCARLGSALINRPVRGIHRDFYPDHVLVDGDRLFLLDFDLYAAGDPALDIGNFLGHITELSLRTFGDPDALEPVQGQMLEAFLEVAGSQHRSAVHTYATLTLVRHIFLSTQSPQRRLFTRGLLELCERRL